MDWRAWRIVAGIACVVLASAACAGPLIVVDLPTGGALGDASASAVRTLESNGYEVVRLGIDDFDLASADIAALCFGSSSELRRQIGGDIAAAVKKGAGVVYLAGSTRGEARDDGEFLARLELKLTGASAREADARISRHRITQGLDASRLVGPPVPYEIVGRSQNALLRQEGRAIAVASEFVKGRVVVWPAEMMAAGPGDDQASLRTELLARSLAWAAGSNEPEKAYTGWSAPAQPGAATANGGPASDAQRRSYKDDKGEQGSVPPGPGQPEDFQGDGPDRPTRPPDRPIPPADNLPPVTTTLSGVALLDIGGTDDDWPKLAGIVEQAVTRAGSSTRGLEYRPEVTPEPLARYMSTSPSLLVIGSHRDFTYSEARAVGNHVRTGGALLAVAYAQPKTQLRMTQFNKILGEFGLAAKLTRPKGRAVVVDQPITRGVHLVELDGGIGIWGFGDWQLVTVEGESVASAMVAGSGRVVVIDGGVLLSSNEREATEFAQLLSQALAWLTGSQ